MGGKTKIISFFCTIQRSFSLSSERILDETIYCTLTFRTESIAPLLSSCGRVSTEMQLSWMSNCTVRLLHGLEGLWDGLELKTFCVFMDNGSVENVSIWSFSMAKSRTKW